MTSTAIPVTIQRAVVTGSAGFIGSHLVKALLDNGVTVIGVDRRDTDNDSEAAANLHAATGRPGFIPILGDLLACAIEPLLLDADVVFHLAGIPGVRPSWGPDFRSYVDCNIVATQRLMHAAVRLCVPRVVVASSSSVYGPADGQPSRETDPPHPASPYGVTKLAEEQLALAQANRQNTHTSVIALRYFTVYGPRQRPDMFIHRALHAATTGVPLRVYGNGRQRRDFTYIDDAVAATIAAATAVCPSTVINVGGATNATLNDVITICEQLTGQTITIDHADSRDGDVPPPQPTSNAPAPI